MLSHSCPLLQTHHMQCTDSNVDFAGVVCSTFDDVHPMAMALSVLVTIEMLNAFNRYVHCICMDAYRRNILVGKPHLYKVKK